MVSLESTYHSLISWVRERKVNRLLIKTKENIFNLNYPNENIMIRNIVILPLMVWFTIINIKCSMKPLDACQKN